MRHKRLHDRGGQRTYAVVLETGEEVELIITESPAHLRKVKASETGLALIRPEA